MGKLKTFLVGMLAGAGALFLSKKENRELVADKAEEMKEKLQDGVESVKEKTASVAKAVKKEE